MVLEPQDNVQQELVDKKLTTMLEFTKSFGPATFDLGYIIYNISKR